MPHLFPEGAQFGADHVVLHASGRRHRVDGFAGPLSIKTVVRGTVAWTVAGRDLVLDASTFLVLGAREPYSMHIEAERPVETACVFFRDGFVEAVARDAAGNLLDAEEPAPPLPRISRLHTGGSIVGNVQSLARRCSAGLMPSGLEQELLLLARDLLILYEDVARRIGNVPAAKAGTRQELFRRVERAREYMHAHAEGTVSLDEVGRAACLSPFHLHRTFVQAWGQTPHEYLTQIRLTRARELLSGGLPVQAASEAVGFRSVSSFSRLFRAIYGVAPGAIRKIGHSVRSGKTLPSAS